MLDIEKLKSEREQAYDVWFERWWERENLEHQINISNSQGYTEYTISITNYNKYEQNRISKKRFLVKLKEKLPGFEIKHIHRTYLFTGEDYLYGVSVRWK